TTEDEYVTLLEAHRNLVAVGEYAFDAETHAKLLSIMRAEYLMFLNKESMENGIINPVLLDRVTLREVKAGRLDPEDKFRKLAAAGGAVLGDSAEIAAHRCKRGDFFFYGAAGSAIVASLLVQNHISPLWLIVAGLLIGFYLNKKGSGSESRSK
ncbi:MAG: hypothetical protein AB7T18_15550, partial [Alphaproteobacteria bacterium]